MLSSWQNTYRVAMPRYEQTAETLNTTKPFEGAQERTAIQIGTVDSLAWNGKTNLAKLMGKHTIEHSFTRMARIWCDEDGKPLIDQNTGEPLPAIEVLAELNPGATDSNGVCSPLRLDPHTVTDLLESRIPAKVIKLFNNAVFSSDKLELPKTKLAVFSQYGDGIWPFVPHTITKEPAFIGDRKAAQEKWAEYQLKAIHILKARHDYHILNKNCHVANATLNNHKHAQKALEEFASRTPIRAGSTLEIPNLPNIHQIVCDNLEQAQNLNDLLHDRLIYLHNEMHGLNKPEDYNHNLFTNPIEMNFINQSLE